MKLVIIDGQSGRMGALLTERVKAAGLPLETLVVGTNAIATAAMMKAGAHDGATGENALILNAGKMDILIGPIGIAMANGLLGEVTPAMAAAVMASNAVKIFLPPQKKCEFHFANGDSQSLQSYIEEAMRILRAELAEQLR